MNYTTTLGSNLLVLRIFIAFSFLFISMLSHSQNCAVNAGLPQTICANEPLLLRGNASGLVSGDILWTQVSGPSTIIVSQNSFDTEVTGIIGGNVYIYRISTNCSDGSYVFQDVEVTVNTTPNVNAGPDQTYCPGDYNLNGSAIPPGGSGEWTIIGTNSAGVVLSTPSSPNSNITLPPGNTGSSTLRWTVAQALCSSFDDVIITNRGGVTPVTAGPNQVLNNCYSATTSTTLAGSFDGNNIDGQTGLWTVVSGPSIPVIGNPSAHNSSLSGLVEGTYILRWTVSGPCASGTATVTINVPPPAGSVSQASV